MPQSTTLYVGMDVHKESIAVADVAQAHGAAVVLLGSVGTRQCGSGQLTRTLPAQATPFVFVDEAAPCGSWLDR